MKNNFIYIIFILLGLIYSCNSCLSGSAKTAESSESMNQETTIDSPIEITDIPAPVNSKIIETFDSLQLIDSMQLSKKQLIAKQFDDIQIDLKQQHQKLDSLLSDHNK